MFRKNEFPGHGRQKLGPSSATARAQLCTELRDLQDAHSFEATKGGLQRVRETIGELKNSTTCKIKILQCNTLSSFVFLYIITRYTLYLGFIQIYIFLYFSRANVFQETYTKAYSIIYLLVTQEGLTLAVMHVGAPACGMNAAVRSFVRNCIYRGDTVLGIHDGMEGFIGGNIVKMEWYYTCFLYIYLVCLKFFFFLLYEFGLKI